MTIYPDYGTPGSPNMDPYYVSPAEEKRLEVEATIATLEAELEAAEAATLGKQMSDDYCFSNGSIEPYLARERQLRLRLKELAP